MSRKSEREAREKLANKVISEGGEKSGFVTGKRGGGHESTAMEGTYKHGVGRFFGKKPTRES